ncbi:MAG TPA: HlyD family efflux transporter periplasmic adaptor subunit [Vicinamibacterales bacterium]|nr:HlyD family efflux transporter periplasmic adaptor subunit [Vicinamibacterales bacterium]
MASARIRRGIFWGLAILVVGAGTLWILRPQPVPVDLGTVTRGPLAITLDHEGQTRVRERYTISAPVSGRVLRIGLEPGDRIIRDRTELATLLPMPAPLLDARTRAEAEARVATATAALEQARAALELARTAAAFAERERDRIARLFAADAVSARERDAAEQEARAAGQSVQVAEAAATAASHSRDVARAALLATDEGRRGGGIPIVLRAPIDGVVLRRVRESEAVVLAGEPLIELGDLATLEVVADFLSVDAVRMQPGMPARIDRWGGAEPLAGAVRRVEPFGFTKISALGVEEQRVNVLVDFRDAPDRRPSLGDGYRVEVRVVVWEAADVLRVPASALFRVGDVWHAWVVGGGDRVESRSVEIGGQTGLAAEVRSGLAEGDRVVLHPSDRVIAGVRIVGR